MEVLTGGRQSGQNLYNALKLYNYINSLPNDTTVRVVKKDGKSIFIEYTESEE